MILNSFRRDFTINALFYNLNERTVEDLTGFGLQDLHNRKPNTLHW
jgi:tRNA nucleotidyltransferase (CCA-adding enzyme)